jgi:RNA polymerase sigma-70 factor (ECF subfamily)
MPVKEEEWAELMRAANAGDARAYRSFLEAAASGLRAFVRRNLARYGASDCEAEDIVQETLLAIHLKRNTWDERRPIGAWIAAIARNKLVDALRRRGRRLEVPLESVAEIAGTDDARDLANLRDMGRLLEALNPRQRDLVIALKLTGASVRETAQRLAMSDGAVRVALHRALAALAASYRKHGP